MPTAGPPPLPSSRPSAAATARQQAAAPNAPNAWSTAANANGYLKRALSNASSQTSNSSRVTRSQNPGVFPIAGPSGLSQMQVAGSSSTATPTPPANAPTGPRGMQQQPYLSPSVAPPAPSAPAASQAGSRYSMRSNGPAGPRPGRFMNGVCELSNWQPGHYKVGEIIAVPFHEPNTNPHVKPGDPHLTKTIDGHAYTKRRLAVILWIYEEDMFCVPLYSFDGAGFIQKPNWLHGEYVSLGNTDDKNFKGQGINPAVFANRRANSNPFHPLSAVHLAGGFKVACRANNSYCGRLTEESYFSLVQMWQKLCNKCKPQQY